MREHGRVVNGTRILATWLFKPVNSCQWDVGIFP